MLTIPRSIVRMAHPTISPFALVWLEYSAVQIIHGATERVGRLAKQVGRWLDLDVFDH